MIPPTVIISALRASATFPGGPTFPIFCQTIANSVTAWLPTGVTVVGVTSGAVGAGTVSGTMLFSGSPALTLAAMSSHGFNGPTSTSLAQVLTLGLNTSLVGLTYAGVSTGVATGTDSSHVTAVNLPSLVTLLQTNHRALCAPLGGTGAQVPGFYTGLAAGIGAIIQTGVTAIPSGIVAPTGPVGVGATVGTSVSSFV